MKPVNDFLDTEDVNPEEVPGFPGFFFFPDDKRIAVNCNGRVLNIKTKKHLKGSPASNGNLYIHVTEPGKPRQVYIQHRIVARTFVGRPSRHTDKPFKKLEVNHIDLVRNNSHYLNLEWVTGVENIKHYRFSDKNTNFVWVLAKNILTNEIHRFRGLRHCAMHFDVDKMTLYKYLKKELTHLFHCDNWIFKFDNGKEWPVVDRRTMVRLGHGTAAILILAESLTVGQDVIFEGIGECAKYFQLGYETVRRRLKRTGAFEHGGYLLKRIN